MGWLLYKNVNSNEWAPWVGALVPERLFLVATIGSQL